MKTKQLLRLTIAVATIGAILQMHAQTVTWNRQAYGQQENYPCGGTYNWPNDNSWDIQEVDSTACGQTYIVQPSNWSTTTYPNGSTFDVVLTAPTAPVSLDIAATLLSLTVQSGAGNINMTYSSSLDVQSYDFQTDGSFTTSDNHGHGGAVPVIHVSGTFKKSAGAGVLDISGENSGNDIYFNIEGGTVEVDSGTLKLSRGESTGGNFTVAANAVLDLNNGSQYGNYIGTYTGSGAGAVQFNSGIIHSAGSGCTFNLGGGLFQWSGGDIAAGAPFTNTGTMTMVGPGNKQIDGGGFHNSGTIIQTGTGNLQFGTNAFITNDAGGTYDIQSDSGVINGDIENYGTFKKSAGTGVSKIWSNNDPNATYLNLYGGTVEVDSGTLMLGRCNNCSGANFNVAAGAVLDLNSGGIFSSYFGTYTGSGAGQLQMNGGQIAIVSSGATFNFAPDVFQWAGGVINACSPLDNEGTITIAGNVGIGCAGFTNNGTIKGNGTINGSLTSNGILAPGDSTGQLNYSGTLTLGSTSNLVFEIGGTTQVTDYDLLNKTDGTAQTLNGYLVVGLIKDFTPAPSDTFTILTTQTTLQGAFNNVASGGRLNTVGGDGSFVVTYSGTNDVTLSNFGPTVCVAPPENLISWWRAEGNANDSIDGNNGALQNGVTFVSGEVGQAFHLNGANQFVQTSNAANLSFEHTNAFSIDAWIRTSDTTHEMIIASKDDSSSPFRGYGLEIVSSEQCAVSNPPAAGAGQLLGFLDSPQSSTCPADSEIAVIGTTRLNDGNWHNVAMTYDGSSSAAGLKLYVDGALENTIVQSDTLGTHSILNSVPFTIGSRANGNFPFNGDIDEVEVFNRALSASEVAAIANAGSAGKCTPSPTPTPAPTATPTPTPTPTLTPTPTPSPTPTPPPSPPPTPPPCSAPAGGTQVEGAGFVLVNNGQASFNFHVQPPGKRVRNTFSYYDPAASIGFEAQKITSLTITGNHARFSGTARLSRRQNVTFTVDVDDFIGCPDQFAIQISNGYFASGEVTNGDISIHN